MKYISLLLITLSLISCNKVSDNEVIEFTPSELRQEQSDIVKVITNEMGGVIITHPNLGKYYEEFLDELNQHSVNVPRNVFKIKFLLADEGFKGSGAITDVGLAYQAFENHIIFNNDIIADEVMLKEVMYKILTQRLALDITYKDSKIMNGVFGDATEEDYNKLIPLIKERWENEFIVVEVVEEL